MDACREAVDARGRQLFELIIGKNFISEISENYVIGLHKDIRLDYISDQGDI